MEAEEKLQVLRDVLDVDFSMADHDMRGDLLHLVEAVTQNETRDWDDDEEFVETLLDNFDDEHPVWQFITLN